MRVAQWATKAAERLMADWQIMVQEDVKVLIIWWTDHRVISSWFLKWWLLTFFSCVVWIDLVSRWKKCEKQIQRRCQPLAYHTHLSLKVLLQILLKAWLLRRNRIKLKSRIDWRKFKQKQKKTSSQAPSYKLVRNYHPLTDGGEV